MAKAKKPLPCGKKVDFMNHFTQEPSILWEEKWNDYLKKKNLRATRPREKIAKIAAKQGVHFEIQKLVRYVHEEDSSISAATIYRTVEALVEANILRQSLKNQTGVPLYEVVQETHHDHIVCLDCGAIIEFESPIIEKTQNETLKSMGFEPSHHQHVIYAHCSDFS